MNVGSLRAEWQRDVELSGFPEDHFSSSSDGDTYPMAVRKGRARMNTSTVAICGLARSIAGILPRTIARIEHTGSMFRDYRVFLVENDSCDSTPQQLASWATRNHRVSITSFNQRLRHYPRTMDPSRTRQMAQLRNLYLCSVQSINVDFAIFLDTDLEVGWSYDGIASTFAHDDWDVVGSNSIVYRSYIDCNGTTKRMPIYYDGWAFRDENAKSFDNGVTRSPFPPSNMWVRCRSCFGGLAVYSARALANVQYGGEDCEHVVLHEQMIACGRGKIFVNPHQITVYNEATPTVTCIATVGEAGPLQNLAIKDFSRQTYPYRELLLVNPGAGHSIVRFDANTGSNDLATPLHFPGYSMLQLRDKAVEYAVGSLVCGWNLGSRHHPQRLLEQVKYLNISYADACVIDGTLLYLPNSREVFWLAHKAVARRWPSNGDLRLHSFMAYRHVAARSAYTNEAGTDVTDAALLLGCEEIVVATPRFGGGWGGGWTTMQVSHAKSAAISQQISYKAVSSRFLLDNKDNLLTILREYELPLGTKVMGYDGLAFTMA